MTPQPRRMKGLAGSAGLVLLAGLLVPSGVLKADTIFDAESVFSSTFGTLDANTGVFTQISTADPAVAGLGEVGGVLYGSDYESTGQLYSINQFTGVFTPVGLPTGLSYYDFGATTSTLFALDTAFNLYSIDTGTGAATLIGSTATPCGGATQLSNNSGTLYLLQCGDLYTVNTATAATTLIGPNSGPYDALSFSGGVLYGAGTLPGTIDTINPATAVSTTGPTITGTTAGDGAIFGIAPATAIPEPGSFLLLFGAISALPLLRRRKG